MLYTAPLKKRSLKLSGSIPKISRHGAERLNFKSVPESQDANIWSAWPSMSSLTASMWSVKLRSLGVACSGCEVCR